MTVRRYETPDAFKTAIEARLKSSSSDGDDFVRRRQLLVFDRFLARAAKVFGQSMTLKGGLVLELRLERARTTKDVDLRMVGSPTDLLGRLQEAGRLDLGDFMRFELQADPNHPDITNPGMKYDGQRYKAECRLAGRIYGSRFGIDIAFGDLVVGDTDKVRAANTLDFAGIEPPTLQLYPIVTHIAEKLHALTMPRPRPSSRVKDLPDIALLATISKLEADLLRRALEEIFRHRGTHELPPSVPGPQAAWTKPYEALAASDELRWKSLDELHEAVVAFLDPVLGQDELGCWDPKSWTWKNE